jgi:hypothetical protein
MIIKKKVDASLFLVYFSDFAEWDGKKHYLIVEDHINGGTITLIYYFPETFTYHRKNESFTDWREIPLNSEMIWKHRKGINKVMKESTNKRLFVK